MAGRPEPPGVWNVRSTREVMPRLVWSRGIVPGQNRVATGRTVISESISFILRWFSRISGGGKARQGRNRPASEPPQAVQTMAQVSRYPTSPFLSPDNCRVQDPTNFAYLDEMLSKSEWRRRA